MTRPSVITVFEVEASHTVTPAGVAQANQRPHGEYCEYREVTSAVRTGL